MAAQLEVALGGMIQGGSTTWSAAAAAAAASNKKRKSAGNWEEERDMVVQLMMGRPLHHHLDINRPSCTSPAHGAAPPLPLPLPPTTLDLLGSTTSSARPPPPPLPFLYDDIASTSPCCFDLDSHSPLPSGWEKCLNLQTGSIYYLNRSTGLSTSSDPRKATTSSVNWPTSPSSSSDLTFEANVPMPSSSKPTSTTPLVEGPNYESTILDLTLSLKPSSPSLRPNSLNHSLNHDPKSDINHNLRSLISSQGLLNNQSFASSISSLPLNSKASFANLPTCTSSTTSTTSPSSPSTPFFQELNVLKDVGSLGSSIISYKESKPMSMNQSVNGMSRPMSNYNANMNVKEKPIARETHNPSPISKNFNVSGKANPIISETHNNASSPMMTMGCANCLMFVMLPKSCSPKCPRCGVSIDSDLPQPPPSMKKPKLAFSLMN